MSATSATTGTELRTHDLYQQWVNDELKLEYTPGMQSECVSEVLPGAVPPTVTPQRAPYGTYAEQLSGTSFTTPRVKNMRTWLYRILPSVKHSPFSDDVTNEFLVGDFSQAKATPQQMRWNPIPVPEQPVQFPQGWRTICGSGSTETKTGMAVHVYLANESMENSAMYNSDGDLLIVPQQEELLIRTEMGAMTVAPGEICVIQRGIRFAVLVKPSAQARGYIAEVFESHFVIPDLGPIGANGLANARHFETVTASYENTDGPFTVINKFLGQLFYVQQEHSCFDVVGWTGNYSPFKYDCAKYVTVNSVSVDHMDPSIFTVLTAPTAEPGVACCDFVIFPPRWSVHTNTFRPPYYHRNCMSEYMGNIRGRYEAKPEGFMPGGGSLHSCMTPHGPDAATFEKASVAELTPVPPIEEALAFMFESTYVFRITDFALSDDLVQNDYNDCWAGLTKHFDPTNKL